MSNVYIRKWGKRQPTFIVDESDGSILGKTDQDHETKGFLKSDWFNGPVIIYQTDGQWKLALKKQFFKLDELEAIENSRGIFTLKTLIITKKECFVLRDFGLMDLVVSKIDPTYDQMDREILFGYWLKSLFDEIKGNE